MKITLDTADQVADIIDDIMLQELKRCIEDGFDMFDPQEQRAYMDACRTLVTYYGVKGKDW